MGDQILSIDNVQMGGSVGIREASEMLQSVSDQVKLEILPFSHISMATAKSPYGSESSLFSFTVGRGFESRGRLFSLRVFIVGRHGMTLTNCFMLLTDFSLYEDQLS